MKRYLTCEIKTASRCHQVTANKWVIVIEPNHLNSWFIQEQNTIMPQKRVVAVFGAIFVVEIDQKTGNLGSITQAS